MSLAAAARGQGESVDWQDTIPFSARTRKTKKSGERGYQKKKKKSSSKRQELAKAAGQPVGQGSVQPGPSRPCTLSRWRRELVVGVGRQGGGEGGGEGRCTGQTAGRYPPSLGHRLGINGGALELGLGPLPVP